MIQDKDRKEYLFKVYSTLFFMILSSVLCVLFYFQIFKNESNKTNELDKFRHQGFNESDFSTNSVSIRQHGDEKKDSGPYDEIILATDTSADEFEEE